MNSVQDLKSIENSCAAALSQVGVKVKSGTGTLPIGNAFSGWVGLNSGRHKGFIRINPFVGVHCQQIMKLVASASGKKYRPSELATFSIYLGELCPEVSQFVFNDGDDSTKEAERLASTIEEFGFPYMRKIASYDALLPLLEKRVPTLGGYPQRYAAALYLSGKIDMALEFTNTQIGLLDNQDSPEVIAALQKLKTLML